MLTCRGCRSTSSTTTETQRPAGRGGQVATPAGLNDAALPKNPGGQQDYRSLTKSTARVVPSLFVYVMSRAHIMPRSLVEAQPRAHTVRQNLNPVVSWDSEEPGLQTYSAKCSALMWSS
eukprot:735714-Rhodomonas_salina.2